MSEEMWRERAQSAEATIQTTKQAVEAAIERVRIFKANFGVRERENGEIDIDFDKFVAALGEANALELRIIIDEHYSTKKPKKKKLRTVA